MGTQIERVAINTGGGDAPGLNAVIHGAVCAARGLGWQICLGGDVTIRSRELKPSQN
jgi:6-phosphofructokinase